MERGTEEWQTGARKSLFACAMVVVAVWILALVLELFNHTTILQPRNDSVLGWCFALSGLCGLLFSCFVFSKSTDPISWRRGLQSFLAGLVAALGLSLFSIRSSEIAEGLLYFPAGKTTSSPALLRIARAYQTHGKGRSQSIQTMPIWSNLEITEQDYTWMLKHRRPADAGGSDDEIASRGYFCAAVVLERSGNAIRVMHAGDWPLPSGSVRLCPVADPPGARQNPSKPMVPGVGAKPSRS